METHELLSNINVSRKFKKFEGLSLSPRKLAILTYTETVNTTANIPVYLRSVLIPSSHLYYGIPNGLLL